MLLKYLGFFILNASPDNSFSFVSRFFKKLNYIHLKLEEEGFVFRAKDYVYSSDNDNGGDHGLLDIWLF